MYVYYQPKSNQFICPDCIGDSNVLVNKNNVTKITGNCNQLKELHIETVKEISKIKELVDTNMREMRSKKKTFARIEQEAANIVKSQFKRVYDELQRVEKIVTETLKTVVAEKLKRFQQIELHHHELMTIFGGYNKNLNHVDRVTDIVRLVQKNKYIQDKMDLKLLTDPLIKLDVNLKFE